MKNTLLTTLIIALGLQAPAQEGTEFDFFVQAHDFMDKGQKDSAYRILVLLTDHHTYFTCDTLANAFPAFARDNAAIMKRCANRDRYNQMPLRPALARIMDSIWQDDQLGRSMLGGIANDASNYRVVDSILSKHGFMGRGELGERGVEAQFLVIQHSSLDEMEKWYPKLKEAVLDGRLQLLDLALFEDRMLMYKGQPQQYGTQYMVDQKTGILVLYPVDDERKANVRRAALGMPPL
jgi:hypothetical protein